MKRMVIGSASAFALLLPVVAQSADYAWQWPLELPAGGDTLLQVQLDESVYQSSIDPYLRDIEVIDADGNSLPASLISPAPSRSQISEDYEARWFPIGAPPKDGADGWRAIIEGQRLMLERSTTTVEPDGGSDSTAEVLVDLGEQFGAVRSLRLELIGNQTDWQAELAVQASSNLESWRQLRSPLRLYRLSHRGEWLAQTRIEWTGDAGRYIRLQFARPIAIAELDKIIATRLASETEAPPLRWVSVQGSLQPDGSWQFELPGALPIRAFDLQAAGEQWLIKFELMSRPWADAGWGLRWRGIDYRQQVAGDWLESPEQDIEVTRDRYWRLSTEQPLRAAPSLKLAYHPDVMLLSSNGLSNIQLVAGSSVGRRIDAPLSPTLNAARSRHGAGWQPPRASLGTRTERAGSAALKQRASPNRLLQLGLWALLVVAALSLLVMAAKLFKEQKA